MVSIRNVHAEPEIAAVGGAVKLHRCGIRHAPVGVHLVGKAGIGDQPIEGYFTIGLLPARLQKDWQAVVLCHVLEAITGPSAFLAFGSFSHDG